MPSPLTFPTPATLISAHRGALARAPENTFAAFELAIREGADVIELDVHPARDGELVVLHDVTTTRTTGRAHRVLDLTGEQVTALDAGSWFAPRFATERIPTLRQVLAWASGRVYLNLDVRNYPALGCYDTAATAAELASVIDRAGAADQVIVQCLDHQLAREVHERYPRVGVGITVHGRPADIVAMARAAGATLISGDAAFATPALAAELHRAGIGLMTSAELRLPGMPDDGAVLASSTARLQAAGVDIVVTDDPAATASALGPGGHASLPFPMAF